MNEVSIPIVITLQLDDTYVTLRIHFLRKDDQPILLIQVEPLWN